MLKAKDWPLMHSSTSDASWAHRCACNRKGPWNRLYHRQDHDKTWTNRSATLTSVSCISIVLAILLSFLHICCWWPLMSKSAHQIICLSREWNTWVYVLQKRGRWPVEIPERKCLVPYMHDRYSQLAHHVFWAHIAPTAPQDSVHCIGHVTSIAWK